MPALRLPYGGNVRATGDPSQGARVPPELRSVVGERDGVLIQIQKASGAIG